MNKLILVAALCLLPLAAAAQNFPSGVGMMEFKEKFKVQGCDKFKGIDGLSFTANGDGTFDVDAPDIDVSGNMVQTDTKGLKWALEFDGGSLATYIAFLETVASQLCGTNVNVISTEFKKFEVKFKKDFSEAKFQLKTKAVGSTAFGDGKGAHQMKGKGPFVQDN